MRKIEDIQTLICCLTLFDSSAPIKISERVGNLDLYARKLMQNAHNYCVENDSQIVGFISFYANHMDTAYLAIIAVDENHKGSGIGSSMLKHAVAAAKEQGMKDMRLEVHKQNAEAIKFYRKNRFEIESDSGEQTYFMIREL